MSEIMELIQEHTGIVNEKNELFNKQIESESKIKKFFHDLLDDYSIYCDVDACGVINIIVDNIESDILSKINAVGLDYSIHGIHHSNCIRIIVSIKEEEE